jgi:hypothetical protein
MTRFVLILAIALATVGSAAADIARGIAAYDAGDYATARRELAAAAEAGDVEAQFRLGDLNLRGQGGQQDVAVALKWYLAAAEKGHGGAQAALGALHALGLGVPRDWREAYFWQIVAVAFDDGALHDGAFAALGDVARQLDSANKARLADRARSKWSR